MMILRKSNRSRFANTCIPKSPINSELQVTSRSSVSPSQSLDTSSIGVLLKQAVDISSSDTDQCVNANPSRSCMSEQKSLEDRKTDTFLDEVHKKKVSNEIRERKREKKLREADSREKNLD